MEINCSAVRWPRSIQSRPSNNSSILVPSASSSTIPPGCSVNKRSVSWNGLMNSKPSWLPRHIVVTAAAIPPSFTAAAASTLPARTALCTARIFLRSAAKSKTSALSRGQDKNTTLWPAALNSAETAFSPSITSTAKETSVGGTVLSIKVPDILSLPPIAGKSSASKAVKAPKRALNGCPQTSVLLSLGKYSCKVRRSLSGSAPRHTARTTDSTTAYIAPWNGLQHATSGW